MRNPHAWVQDSFARFLAPVYKAQSQNVRVHISFGWGKC